ncbi:glycosyltransferase [Desulfonatronum sp. SC1]|uniref:glycosyltransferase n=1 Tax=Desulfonatronum sp. SC1 TaxID=2109626 RepID=UPI000D2F6EAE|nr:glycosyltransferase [Desulfonatronum sp. SC1]PTN36512.1 glycosyl transferase [Desulfonatronum sp. SC1]
MKPRLAILVPLYNDWPSFIQLASAIDNLVPSWGAEVTLYVVDDGSTTELVTDHLPQLRHLTSIERITLAANLGHQRAIAVGLCELAQSKSFDAVIIADSDGQDRPEHMLELFAAHSRHPEALVAAQRSKRSENFIFRLSYTAYKYLFKLLTGKSIDFGNFCLVPQSHLQRLTHMPEVWNHLAAATVRSRLPIIRVATPRGERYAGRSSMNILNLIVHGLSAISVFTDILFVRLLILSGCIAGVALVASLVATIIRFTTQLPIIGLPTLIVGFSGVLLFQSATFAVIAALMMLSTRSSFPFVPAHHAARFIAKKDRITQRFDLSSMQD